MVPPIALERPALSAELQKHQFIATETTYPVSLVIASVDIWDHLSAGDAVQIVSKNSVTEIPNRFLKVCL
ncbi:unnamed protein product [Urochloa decumbens]|uniref:Uncharacterized protein n=1 Tax=Urochloa decumbens TaxID=240449 RepID=A0ABC9BS96_9POAL